MMMMIMMVVVVAVAVCEQACGCLDCYHCSNAWHSAFQYEVAQFSADLNFVDLPGNGGTYKRIA